MLLAAQKETLSQPYLTCGGYRPPYNTIIPEFSSGLVTSVFGIHTYKEMGNLSLNDSQADFQQMWERDNAGECFVVSGIIKMELGAPSCEQGSWIGDNESGEEVFGEGGELRMYICHEDNGQPSVLFIMPVCVFNCF
jgi:hypothetical protein